MLLADLMVMGAVVVAMAIIALSVSFTHKKLAFVIWGISVWTFYVMVYTMV